MASPPSLGCRDTEHPLGRQSQPPKQRTSRPPSGRACRHPPPSPPHRGHKHARRETEAAPVTPPPTTATSMHTSGTVTCIGVSSYLLHSTHMIGVKLLTHARSTMRRITNSVLSKKSARLGTMESIFLRCEAQRESKLRLRLGNVSVATARTPNIAMHSCIRRAQLRRSAEHLVHNALQIRPAGLL